MGRSPGRRFWTIVYSCAVWWLVTAVKSFAIMYVPICTIHTLLFLNNLLRQRLIEDQNTISMIKTWHIIRIPCTFITPWATIDVWLLVTRSACQGQNNVVYAIRRRLITEILIDDIDVSNFLTPTLLSCLLANSDARPNLEPFRVCARSYKSWHKTVWF